MLLYEINQAYQELLNLELEQEDFELALNSINMELESKAENIGYVLQELKGNVNTLDNEIKRLQAKKQALNNKIDTLTNYLSTNMLQMDVKKIDTPLFTFSFRKSESIVIDDNTLVPAIYKESVVTEKIDKRALKKAFKEESIPGCHIEVKQNLQLK